MMNHEEKRDENFGLMHEAMDLGSDAEILVDKARKIGNLKAVRALMQAARMMVNAQAAFADAFEGERILSDVLEDRGSEKPQERFLSFDRC